MRFGIIGPGTIGGFHAKAIAEVDGAELSAVYGRTATTREAFAAEHGAEACASLGELLDRVDAVTIATPTGAHGEPAMAAAEAGKHVLCEKPLEVTADKADAIIAACREAGVVLAPVFQQRFGAAAQLVKRAIDSGRLGDLRLASARIRWFRDQAYYDSGGWRGTWELDGGGCLMNQGIHTIDLLLWFAGAVDAVSGRIATVDHERIEVEDLAAASLRFASGALGTIEGATSCPPGQDAIVEISGSRGTVRLEADRLAAWEMADEDALDAEAAELMGGASALGSGAADPKAISVEGHKRQIADLLAAVAEHRVPALDPAEARRPIACICAVYESARRDSTPVAP